MGRSRKSPAREEGKAPDFPPLAEGGSGAKGGAHEMEGGFRLPVEKRSSHPWLWPLVTAAVVALLVVAGFALRPRDAASAETRSSLYSITLIAPMGDEPITTATRDGKPVPALETVVSPEGLRVSLEPGRYRIEWGESRHLSFIVPEDGTIVLLDGVSEQIDAVLDGSGAEPGVETVP